MVIESLSRNDIGYYTCRFKNKNNPKLVFEASILLFNEAQENNSQNSSNLIENFLAEEKDDDVPEDKEVSTSSSIPIIKNYAQEDKIRDDMLLHFSSNFRPVMYEHENFSISCSTRGKFEFFETFNYVFILMGKK